MFAKRKRRPTETRTKAATTTMTMRTVAAATAVVVAPVAARGADDVMTFYGRVMAMGGGAARYDKTKIRQRW